jgi:CRP-like cAMP-binding protein
MRLRPEGARRADDQGGLRAAAWVARCVGQGSTSPLDPADLDALATVLETRRFARGAVVFDDGDPADAVWIVRSGAIGLYAGSAPDRVLLAVLRAGDVDGDLPVLLAMPFQYRAEALEDATCLRLAAATFSELLETRPTLARRWHMSVAARLARSQQRLIDLLGVPLVQQVARVVLDEAVNDTVPYSQATLAALLGVRRPSVNKVVKDLERRGIVESSYRSIAVRDRAALSSVAGRAPSKAT